MTLPLVTAAGYIKSGKLRIRDRASFDSAVSGLKDGWEVEVEICRLRATRSGQSNRYYWGVVIKALSDHTGYSPSEIHDLLKCKFLPKHLAVLKGGGDIVAEFVLGGSTRTLDTAEFAEYLNQVIEWCASELDIYIPSPDEFGYGGGI